jgi:hypothetical protein
MLKDQIIALNLELDDKAKIEQLLKRKIELEKSYLSRIESEINERFDAITKVCFIIDSFWNSLVLVFCIIGRGQFIRIEQSFINRSVQ